MNHVKKTVTVICFCLSLCSCQNVSHQNELANQYIEESNSSQSIYHTESTESFIQERKIGLSTEQKELYAEFFKALTASYQEASVIENVLSWEQASQDEDYLPIDVESIHRIDYSEQPEGDRTSAVVTHETKILDMKGQDIKDINSIEESYRIAQQDYVYFASDDTLETELYNLDYRMAITRGNSSDYLQFIDAQKRGEYTVFEIIFDSEQLSYILEASSQGYNLRGWVYMNSNNLLEHIVVEEYMVDAPENVTSTSITKFEYKLL